MEELIKADPETSLDQRKQSVDITDECLRLREWFIKARFYRWFMTTYGGNWIRVAQDIERETGVKIDDESLRQNILPSNQTAGKPPRRFKDIKRLRALYDFTVAVECLAPEELNDSDSILAPAYALDAFINGSRTILDEDTFACFDGVFVGEIANEDYEQCTHLHFQAQPKSRTLQVQCTEWIEANGGEEKYDEIHYDGWAVLNDGGLVMIVVRAINYDLLSFLVLQTHPTLEQKQVVTDIAVLRYDGVRHCPSEIEGNPPLRMQVLGFNLNQLCLFLTKIGVSGKKRTQPAMSKKRFFVPVPQQKAVIVAREQPNDPDQEFIARIRKRRYVDALGLIDKVQDINVKDAATGATALHFAAARAARFVINALEQRSDLNYLVKDMNGFLPSEVAWGGGHEVLGAELMQKEQAQKGVPIKPKTP